MRNLHKLLIISLLIAMMPMHMSAAADAVMPTLRITLIDGTITRNMTEYVNGTMQLTDADGNVVEMNAKFRNRGATAKSYTGKPSLNMKLRNDDYTAEQDSSLLGMRSCSSWILDAMAIDRIEMRNRVAMDIWNSYSKLPYTTDFNDRNGTEGQFLEVYLNDTYLGIYCLSDRINRKLLNLKKYDETKQRVRGVLYKCGTEDISNQNEYGFNEDSTACCVSYHNAYELKEPEDYPGMEAWKPLIDLQQGTHSADTVRKYFFMDNLVDYQLLIMALGIQDNWGNKNYFFSIRNIQKDINDADETEAARRKFVVTPWDLDTSLGGRYDGSYYTTLTDSGYVSNYSSWAVSDVSKNGFYPFSSMQGDSEYKALMKARWAEIRTEQLSPIRVNERMNTVRDLFLNSGAWERTLTEKSQSTSAGLTVEDLATEVYYVQQWYAARFKEMDEYFGTSSLIGDANADGEVTVADANAIVNYYLGDTTTYIDLSAADVNGDGEITIADANETVNLYLDK